MKLESYIRPKPRFFRIIPWLSNFTANSLYPFIFLPQAIYQDLQSDVPNPAHIALLIHEKTHYERQQKMGVLKFGLKYLFSPTFRFSEELIAVQAAMRYLKAEGLSFNFETKATNLSSWMYLWPVSKTYARDQLQQLWDKT